MSRSRTRTHATAAPAKAPARPVSKPHDRHEREAEHAADVVARGGSVSGFAFSAVPASAPVQRQDEGKPKSDDEKKQEALKKAGEAFLETKPGKELKDKVLADPVVKTVKDAATSPAGIAVGVTAAAGGVAALAATHKALPFQPPAIPLDRITPGLSAQVKYEGPVDKPTFVGLTLSYKAQGPTPKGKGDGVAADTARLRAQAEMFKPEAQKQAEKREEDAFVHAWISSQRFPSVTVPLTGTTPAQPAEEKKKPEEPAPAPVQKAPASSEAAPAEHVDVDDALATPGRPLDPSTRRSMEARFGYDFSSVRLHDDARAAATAAEIDAAAFTVGEHVVFGSARFAPSTPEGRRLLAHELAHVVQQTRGAPGGAGPIVQRRSVFESLGILLGIVEGTWEDRELHEYLDAVARTGRIEDAYDSDNKARAIVRRWKTSTPGFDLSAPQKILLIREMLSGPTLGDDEECILDLLRLSDPTDLRAIFATGGISLANLESDINGLNRWRLDTFVAHRFEGGRQAVLAGRVQVIGATVPAGAPNFTLDVAALDASFDSSSAADDLIALVAAMTAGDQAAALHHLISVRRPRLIEAAEAADRQATEATDTHDRDLATQLAARLRARRLKTERVILHFFHEAIPATAADLRAGTMPVDPERRAELREALHPPTHAGGTARFRSILPGQTQSYEAKLRAQVPTIVNDYHTRFVTGHGPAEHADPALTHSLVEFEAIGNAAKHEVDRAYGRFYDPASRPALVADQPGLPGNVHDQFADIESRLAAMTPQNQTATAKAWLRYIYQSNGWVRQLNAEHDATPQFDSRNLPLNDEARAQDRVANDFVGDAAHVTRLNEIQRNWFAMARPATSEIFFQIFREPTPEADRLLLWDVFQTFIHEYLHTLAHPDYRAYARSFGTSNANNTLVEGVDSLLTEIVWSAIEPRITDPDLREKVEGTANAALPPITVPHASRRRYASYTEALHLADLVGIPNLYAAYFLGLVDRIGGPSTADSVRMP